MRVDANIEDFKVKKDSPLPADENPTITMYNRDGNQADNLWKAVAKRAIDPGTGKARFFIRFDSEGRPLNVKEYLDAEIKAFDDGKGSARFPFRSVSQEAFDCYMRFLRTGNANHLKSCERV